jgi:hypothetical protein
MDKIKEILDVNNLRKQTIFNSINSPLKDLSQEEIEKGVLDDLSYSDDMKFIKTGKEIKEKLSDLKTKLLADISTNITERTLLLKEINATPTEEPYVYGDYKDSIGELPLKFSWKDIEQKDSSFTNLANIETPNNSGNDSKYKYNDLVQQYICAKQDLKKIELIEANLNDKASIKLNLRNLSALGF